LAGVDFEKLGLPNHPDRSYAANSETVQHTIYAGLVAPTALLGGLMFLIHRAQSRTKQELLEQERQRQDDEV